MSSRKLTLLRRNGAPGLAVVPDLAARAADLYDPPSASRLIEGDWGIEMFRLGGDVNCGGTFFLSRFLLNSRERTGQIGHT
jgi:hypothetical protein